jgi:hypothetical protein
MDILQIKDKNTGKWIAVPALKGSKGDKGDTPDLTDYVKNSDLAEHNGNKAGLVYLAQEGTYGLNLEDFDGVKRLVVYGAKESYVKAKQSAYMPLTPSMIDLSVKIGLTDSRIEWTEDEKTSARTQLGSASTVYEQSYVDVNDWEEQANGYWRAVLPCSVVEGDTPILDVVTTNDDDANFLKLEAWSNVFRATTYTSSVWLYAKQKPQVAFHLAIKVVR